MSRTISLSLLLGLSALLFLPVASAQDGRDDMLETAWDKQRAKYRSIVSALVQGNEEADPLNKDHMAAIDWEVRGVVYRLWWNRTKRDETLHEIVDGKAGRPGFQDTLNSMTRIAAKEGGVKAGTLAPMQRLFCKAVARRARDIVPRDAALVSVNAARVLYLITAREPKQSITDWVKTVGPRVGGDTGDYLADTLADLSANASVNDGARFHLLRALGDLLSLPTKTPVAKKETVLKGIKAALLLLDRKADFPRNTPREELEGFKVLRWQALRVLAAAGFSEAGEKDRPALYLARAAGGDVRVVPPPRLDEQMEGINGLARMIGQGDKHPNLQPDYAALQVARGVAAFGLAANENRNAKAAGRLYAWKAEAARLLEAVNIMAKNKDEYARKVAVECRAVLEKVEKGDLSEAADLVDWTTKDENKPKSTSLFKGEAGTTVNVK
jgi:hypothetical protein